MFIRSNNVVDIGHRGIWGHVASDIYYIDNVVANVESDGIDIDAHNHFSKVLFNVLRGNVRSGVFIEEGVSFNTVYGNRMVANLGQSSTGILFYSYLARKALQDGDENWQRLRNRNNLFVGNLVEEHRNGMNTRYAEGCAFMHNVFRHNEVGIHAGFRAANIYLGQNVAYDNTEADVSEKEAPFAPGEFYGFSRDLLE